MILTGPEIHARLGKDIEIDPFDERRLNPNSYNLTLHDELIFYEEIVLDMRRPNRYTRLIIPPEGLVLTPNRLYLGRTVERTETHNLVPMLEGRSSIGRLGSSSTSRPDSETLASKGFGHLRCLLSNRSDLPRCRDLPDLLPHR